jgi:hypothetical protein
MRKFKLMNLTEILQYAKEYLKPDHDIRPVSEFRLHGQLQYRLCGTVERLQRHFKEVTHKDIALLCEAWIMAQAAVRPQKALLHDSEWDDGTSKPNPEYKGIQSGFNIDRM